MQSIEKPEADIMKLAPRKPNEAIISGHILTGIIGHAFFLVLFMLLSYALGLWWEIGTVFLDQMYEGDNLMDECKRLNDVGVFEPVYDKNCVKDGLTVARTMVFLTITFSESLRPLTARSSSAIMTELFSNMSLIYAILFSFTCTFVIIFTPGVNDIFHVSSPRWFEWLLVVAGVLITIIADEHLKGILRKQAQKDSRWHQLFDQLKDASREIRNMRAHLEHKIQ